MPNDHPRRHGRLLRLGRGARSAGTPGQADHRWRESRSTRRGQKFIPVGIGRKELEAYLEIARLTLNNPNKATQAGRSLQELRVTIIEELLKGLK